MRQYARQARPFAKLGIPCLNPHSLRIFFQVLLFVFLLFMPATQAWSRPDSSQDNIARQYEQAKAYYQDLSTGNKGKDRSRWLTSVTAFRSIYKAAPDHQVAPKSLYMLGKIFHTMFQQSGKTKDLDQAISAYEELSSRYPGNALADDAFFILGTIYLADKKDPGKAARAFTKIIAIYPEGDMAGSAEEQLLQLKTVPVPNSSQIEAGEKCLTPRDDSDPPQQVLSPQKSGHQATVLPIRHWSNSRYTRLVVETTGPVTFKHQVLSGDKASQRRIYIDLHNSRLSPDTVRSIPIDDGLLRRVRNAQFDPKTVRVVLDTQTNISDYKVFTLADPFRVVIDVMSSDGAAAEKTGKAGTKETIAGKGKKGGNANKGEPSTQTRPLVMGIKRIVIDPGHGGKDPGTCSPNGLKEKDIVLDVALRVAKILKEKIGCEVILTRDRDVFIPLEERTAIANAKEADLFLSIHVNAAPNHDAKGIETYVLDLTNNKDAMRLAALENATSAKQISDLQSILLDLMQNSKINESLKLAGLVQEEMVSGLNKKFSDVSNLGVKKAPFVVLIGAQMPAILTEIAFLSNPEEEKRLKNTAYLTEVANHISSGVAQYVESMSLAANYRYSSPNSKN
ncbi:MAG: N-acetylmuramoyl-L-alanine amidase [Proteobacteria bacterium]|nr:N-acetylmuramoyl-L-alanine amidase [Pseudomonadota bacterium]